MGSGVPYGWAAVPPRTVTLVGLMGAGKTAIGKRLAARLGLPFVDADLEIESAAACSIEDYFLRHGEAAFREGELRVIARLLERPVHILATGGGAFIDQTTRALMRQRAISVWLRADLEVLVARTARRNNRPLLKQGDPRDVLAHLIKLRYPIYAEADLTIDSEDTPLDDMVERVLVALETHLGQPLLWRPAAVEPQLPPAGLQDPPAGSLDQETVRTMKAKP